MRRTMVAAALLALALGVGWWLRPVRFHFAWPAGTRIVYAVDWQGQSRMKVPGMADDTEGAFDVDADLVVHSEGKRDGVYRLRLSLAAVRRYHVRALGQEMEMTPVEAQRLLIGPEALLEVAEDGTARGMEVRASDPAQFRNLVQQIAAQLSVTVPSRLPRRWEADEPTAFGEARSAYSLESSSLELQRVHTRYQGSAGLGPECQSCSDRIQSKAAVELNPAGHLRSLLSEELLTRMGAQGEQARRFDHFRAVESRLEVAAAPAAWVRERVPLRLLPGAPAVEAGDVQKKLLAQRVGGITFAEVEQMIRMHAQSGGAPPKGFVYRASGLLMQHPELCEDLAELASEDELGSRGRALAMDLLASAAGAPAQAAMRTALGAEAVVKDPAYFQLLQRLSFVPRPNRDTVAFLESAARTGDRDRRLAAVTSLGAAASHLRDGGNVAEADRLAAQLGASLAGAQGNDRAALLVALGESRAAGAEPTLLASLHDDDAAVRAGAAEALSWDGSASSRAGLTEMLGDDTAGVRNAALRALDNQPASADDWGRLQSLVSAGPLAPGVAEGLVTLAANHAHDSAGAGQLLENLLSTTDDRRLQARIKYVMSQLE
jgi:hypothetical protein